MSKHFWMSAVLIVPLSVPQTAPAQIVIGGEPPGFVRCVKELVVRQGIDSIFVTAIPMLSMPQGENNPQNPRVLSFVLTSNDPNGPYIESFQQNVGVSAKWTAGVTFLRITGSFPENAGTCEILIRVNGREPLTAEEKNQVRQSSVNYQQIAIALGAVAGVSKCKPGVSLVGGLCTALYGIAAAAGAKAARLALLANDPEDPNWNQVPAPVFDLSLPPLRIAPFPLGQSFLNAYNAFIQSASCVNSYGEAAEIAANREITAGEAGGGFGNEMADKQHVATRSYLTQMSNCIAQEIGLVQSMVKELQKVQLGDDMRPVPTITDRDLDGFKAVITHRSLTLPLPANPGFFRIVAEDIIQTMRKLGMSTHDIYELQEFMVGLQLTPPMQWREAVGALVPAASQASAIFK